MIHNMSIAFVLEAHVNSFQPEPVSFRGTRPAPDPRNWQALQYASMELRRDVRLCLEAVQQPGSSGEGSAGIGALRIRKILLRWQRSCFPGSHCFSVIPKQQPQPFWNPWTAIAGFQVLAMIQASGKGAPLARAKLCRFVTIVFWRRQECSEPL